MTKYLLGLLFLFNYSFSQNINYPINKNIATSIPNEVKIVGLGDPTHQESTITKYRIDLIKELVQEKDFSIIAIEGNFYEIYHGFKSFLQTKDYSYIEKAMYSQLNADIMIELYDFLYEQNKNGKTVLFTGFDVHFSGSVFSTYLKEDLKKVKSLSAEEKEDFVNIVEKGSHTDLRVLLRNNKKVRTKNRYYSKRILETFNPVSIDDKYFVQALTVLSYDPEKLSGDSDNNRDFMMAKNVGFLRKNFADSKIILFGSSSHLVKSPKYIYTPGYLNNRYPLGWYLNETFSSEYYFIAYSALSGNKLSMFNKPVEIDKVIDNSIEGFISKEGKRENFITSQKYPLKNTIHSRLLGHTFYNMNLWNVVDGLVLIDNVEPFRIIR